MNRRDTTEDARKVLVDIYRQMPPSVKFKQIFEAYQTGKMLAMAGLRLLHPQASEKQIWYLWAKRHLGEELFKKVYGTLPDE
jgi:hypothetical protein